jgi:hypothetical protein
MQPWAFGPAPAGVCPAYWKINRFLESNQDIARYPSDYYLFLADDCWYAPDFFAKIRAHNGPVIIASALRGQHIPPGGIQHGTSPLIAAPENMKVGSIDLGQIIVRGDVAAKMRFDLDNEADGRMAAWLKANYPIDYAPEAHFWFNYLQPERWDDVP